MSARRVRLVSWGAGELAEQLGARGWRVEAGGFDPDVLRALREDPPDAVVIDLAKRPATGRDAALALRTTRATRAVPILFVGGDERAIERVQAALPDALFASARGLDAALRRAVEREAVEPIVPRSRLAGYSGTPLAEKLGIREGARVLLVDAPEGFEALLGELPAGAKLVRRGSGAFELVVLFARSAKELARRLPAAIERSAGGRLWIAWPKKGSALEGDLGGGEVRAAGLAAGLVDFKVCAIDATWSGHAFARRRA